MGGITLKSAAELTAMETSCRIAAEIVAALIPLVRPGITTASLDHVAREMMRTANVKPAFEGYHGYPATICTSVNDEVVHVIPSERVLVDGDILSIDAGVIYNGMYSDMAVTVPVGTITAQAKRLIQVTHDALYLGIDQARVGARVGAVSHAIETFVTAQGFEVVRELVGHGIGRALHEDPPVPNFGPERAGPVLKEGMAIAIEPMVTVGSSDVVIDGWRIATKDGSLSAHFEHTVAILADGPKVLTELPSA